MHLVKRAHAYSFLTPPVFARHSQGYARATLVDSSCGSVHTGLTLNRLEPGGQIAPHLHSFEESVYILEGRLEATLGDAPAALDAGDFAVIRWHPPRVAQHRNRAGAVARNECATAQGQRRSARHVLSVDRASRCGAWSSRSDESFRRQPDSARRSAAGRPGQRVFLKWLIDEPFGAVHHRLVFIEYQPGAAIAPHDHTFEEAYFIIGGEVEAVVDGERHLVGPGDVVWTAVGCVHSFKNIGSGPVRWLETFSPSHRRRTCSGFGPNGTCAPQISRLRRRPGPIWTRRRGGSQEQDPPYTAYRRKPGHPGSSLPSRRVRRTIS